MKGHSYRHSRLADAVLGKVGVTVLQELGILDRSPPPHKPEPWVGSSVQTGACS